MNFEDHFSQRAETYAQFRPHYPAELFAYLAGVAPGQRLAWDCATGSGQAALGLADHFAQVIATDASAQQIAQAAPHPRVAYRVEPAESTRLAEQSVDLVTVAVAVHWFEFERFYAEVRRVLKPGGVVAVWTYHRPRINPALDAWIARLEDEILGAYWPERIRYLQDRYQSLPFPFAELTPPAFTIQARWTLAQLVGFISSWSGARRYEEEHGIHPLKPIWDEFRAAWGSADSEQDIHWPLYLRVGRV